MPAKIPVSGRHSETDCKPIKPFPWLMRMNENEYLFPFTCGCVRVKVTVKAVSRSSLRHCKRAAPVVHRGRSSCPAFA